MKKRWDGRRQRQRWTVEGEQVGVEGEEAKDGDREEERYEAEGMEGDGGRVGRRWRWQRRWGVRGEGDRREKKDGEPERSRRGLGLVNMKNKK